MKSEADPQAPRSGCKPSYPMDVSVYQPRIYDRHYETDKDLLRQAVPEPLERIRKGRLLYEWIRHAGQFRFR